MLIPYLSKEKIARSFSESAQSYNNWAFPQNQAAETLVRLIDTSILEGKLLDAGCGTGLLSKHLMGRQSDSDIHGLDISEQMLSSYQEVNKSFSTGDIENLPFKDGYFSHSLSSFALHWTHLGKSLPELVRVTHKYLSFALPIEGSLTQFNFPFPDKGNVLRLLEKAGIEVDYVETHNIPIPYEGLELIKFFHYTGSSFNGRKRDSLITKGWLDNLIRHNQNESHGFIVLYVLGHKI